MPLITPEEVRSLFPKPKDEYDYPRYILETMVEDEEILFGKKDSDILEVFDLMLSREYYPMIDAKSGVIFAGVSGSHLPIAQNILKYYWGEEKISGSAVGRQDSRDVFIETNMGYFVSSVAGNHIIVSESYQPDNFDQVLFARYSILPTRVR